LVKALNIRWKNHTPWHLFRKSWKNEWDFEKATD
jgi:hypothetical protein